MGPAKEYQLSTVRVYISIDNAMYLMNMTDVRTNIHIRIREPATVTAVLRHQANGHAPAVVFSKAVALVVRV